MEDKIDTDNTPSPNMAIDLIDKKYMEMYLENGKISKRGRDVPGFKFVVTSDLEYAGVIITETLDEPYVYTDTEVGEFQAYSGGDKVTRSIPTVVLNAIDEYYADVYENFQAGTRYSNKLTIAHVHRFLQFKLCFGKSKV